MEIRIDVALVLMSIVVINALGIGVFDDPVPAKGDVTAIHGGAEAVLAEDGSDVDEAAGLLKNTKEEAAVEAAGEPTLAADPGAVGDTAPGR